MGWLRGGDTLLDPRFQTIFGLLDKASKLDGGVERIACRFTWQTMRQGHVVNDKERYCMLLYKRHMKARRAVPTYTSTYLIETLSPYS